MFTPTFDSPEFSALYDKAELAKRSGGAWMALVDPVATVRTPKTKRRRGKTPREHRSTKRPVGTTPDERVARRKEHFRAVVLRERALAQLTFA